MTRWFCYRLILILLGWCSFSLAASVKITPEMDRALRDLFDKNGDSVVTTGERALAGKAIQAGKGPVVKILDVDRNGKLSEAEKATGRKILGIQTFTNPKKPVRKKKPATRKGAKGGGRKKVPAKGKKGK